MFGRQLVAAVSRESDCTRRTAYRIVERAVNSGLFTVDKKGIARFDYWSFFLRTAGRAMGQQHGMSCS